MTEFLVKHFIKDYEHVEKVSVRTAYGMLSGIVGIFCNIILFLVKAASGFILHSVSVTADAFNNLSDAGSSVISLVGVKMAEMPADKRHPFGHGRVEYISALLVSFIVIEVGLTFLKDSFSKIRHPQELNFQLVTVLVLLVSIGIKLWLGLFNRKLGRKIDSKVLMAVFTDSVGDVLTTAATVFSVVFYAAAKINIDGFIGLGVSLVVMWAGFGIAKDTLEPLIGSAIDPELYIKIQNFVEKYDGIEGSHDLIVHNYGPGRSMASIHAEVPNNVDIEVSHEIIDRIEREAKEELGIFLVIHMDPIETENEAILKLRAQVEKILERIDTKCSIHDFRVVEGVKQINLIFDMVVPISYNEEKKKEITDRLKAKLAEEDCRFNCVITIEHSFVFNTDTVQRK